MKQLNVINKKEVIKLKERIRENLKKGFGSLFFAICAKEFADINNMATSNNFFILYNFILVECYIDASLFIFVTIINIV